MCILDKQGAGSGLAKGVAGLQAVAEHRLQAITEQTQPQARTIQVTLCCAASFLHMLMEKSVHPLLVSFGADNLCNCLKSLLASLPAESLDW